MIDCRIVPSQMTFSNRLMCLARTGSRTQENRGVDEAALRRVRSNDVPVTKTVAVAHTDVISEGRRSPLPPHPEVAVQSACDPITALHSRFSPQAELERDIQRLGLRPVGHSASYHFDHHPSSRRYVCSSSQCQAL